MVIQLRVINKILRGLLVESELHNYTWPWSDEVERDKEELANLQRTALCMMKTGEGVKGHS
jgi:hypothetical protein